MYIYFIETELNLLYVECILCQEKIISYISLTLQSGVVRVRNISAWKKHGTTCLRYTMIPQKIEK